MMPTLHSILKDDLRRLQGESVGSTQEKEVVVDVEAERMKAKRKHAEADDGRGKKKSKVDLQVNIRDAYKPEDICKAVEHMFKLVCA